MTSEQYQKILPYKPTILGRAASGNTAGELGALYTEMTGSIPKLHCGACVGEMLDYLTGQIHKYETSEKKENGGC